ncbi:MAG: hypothetical protein IPL61_35145 [Myxococcales bacterium]|nr:hypothetical protein [Myxococcales bacterium]
MRARTFPLICALALGVTACGGKAAPPRPPAAQAVDVPAPQPVVPPPPVDALPTIPSTPQPAPADLLATGTIGDPIATLTALIAYADAVKPGIGAVLNPASVVQMAAAQGLDLRGVDLSRPARALVLDPKRNPAPLVVVVAVADERALRTQVDALDLALVVHDGWAAIGSPAALRAAAPYALTTAVTLPAPAMPQVSIDIAAVMTRYKPMLAGFIDGAIAAQPPNLQVYTASSMRAYLELFDQLDRLDLALELDRDRASVAMMVAPRAGTGVAAFTAQQRPGDFKLLERLGAAPMMMGGRLETGAVFTQLLELSAPMVESMYGAQLAGNIGALFARWPTLANGENAMTLDLTGGKVSAAGLWDITDGAAAQQLWFDYLTALGAAAGGTMATTVDVKAATYRGVRFARGHTVATTAATKASMSMYGGQLDFGYAVPGKLFAVALGQDVVAQLRALTDIALPKKRATTKVAPGLAATLAQARTRGDSFVVAIDAPAIRSAFQPSAGAIPPAAELAAAAIGVHGGALTLRLTMPASQLAPLVP